MTTGGKTYPAGPGTILASEADRIDVALLGGVLHVQRAQRIGGKKLSAAEFASEMGVVVGDGFEDGVVRLTTNARPQPRTSPTACTCPAALRRGRGP